MRRGAPGSLRRRWDDLVSWALWPLLLGGAMLLFELATAAGHSALGFDLAYVALALAVGVLERVRPHARAWQASDGQIAQDLGHTLLNKGVIRGLLSIGVVIGLAEPVAFAGRWPWPVGWPLAAQVALALVAAELALYTAHRLAHEWAPLWRFHAVHHSSERLWFVNTGRFHVVDSLAKTLPSLGLGIALGAPTAVIVWVAAITAFIGLLTHANIRMRFGLLSWVFNTPELHRWHHSRQVNESQRNYGENLMLFDHLCGTYLRPRRPGPRRIGIGARMPRSFLGQLRAPFAREPSAAGSD